MPKPLIFTDSRSLEDRFDPSVVEGFDNSYIPGYSEQVRANDIAKADPLYFREAHKSALRADGKQGLTQEDVYKQIGAGPTEMEIELNWLRVAAPNGSNSYTADAQLAQDQREGWQLCPEEVLKKHGYGFPPAAHKESDGSIRRLDVALYWRPARLARRWSEYKTQKALEAEGTALPDSLDVIDPKTGKQYTAATVETRERTTQTVTTSR